MGTHLVPRDTNAAALAVATPAEETLREGGMVIVPEFWWACVLSTAWWMRTVNLGKSAASQDVAASASPDSSCSTCPRTPTSPMGLHLNQSFKHPSCSDLSGIFWKPRRGDVLGLVTLPQISGLLSASAAWSTHSPGDRSFSFSIKDWHGPSRLYCVGPQMRWGVSGSTCAWLWHCEAYGLKGESGFLNVTCMKKSINVPREMTS